MARTIPDGGVSHMRHIRRHSVPRCLHSYPFKDRLPATLPDAPAASTSKLLLVFVPPFLTPSVTGMTLYLQSIQIKNMYMFQMKHMQRHFTQTYFHTLGQLSHPVHLSVPVPAYQALYTEGDP